MTRLVAREGLANLAHGRSGSWLTLFLATAVGLLAAKLPILWLVLLLGGTAVLLLTLIKPKLGLLTMLLAAPWGALENVRFGPNLLDSGQLLLLLLIAVWLAHGLSHRRLTIPHTFLTLPLALFLFVGGLSLLQASSFTAGAKELIKWLQLTAVMLIAVDLSLPQLGQPTKPNEQTAVGGQSLLYLVGILLLAGLSQAVIGIWQFALRGDGPEHFLVLGRFYRAYGTFEQPNPFAGYVNLSALLAIGICLGLLASAWPWLKRGKWPLHRLFPSPTSFLWLSLFVAATAVLGSLAVLFSWSRGAWLSFAAGGAVLLLFWPRKLWQGVALLTIGLLIFGAGMELGLVPSSVSERITSFSQDLRFGDVRGVAINDANYAVLERLAHWQAALEMAKQNVWLGVGFGNYETVYADYALINWPYALGHAHNYYLNLLAEMGALGLGAYLLFWTAVFFQTIRLLTRLDWPVRGIALGLLAAWTAVTVHHLVDKLYVNNLYLHLGVMLGLLQLLDHMNKNKTETSDH